MGVELAVILILGFIIIYVFIIDVFAILFRITGLTREKAKFQAISMLTCCGFTTSEAEIITGDKVRRKIAVIAMITGYAFSVVIVSLVINLLVSLNKTTTDSALDIIILSFLGFIALIIIFRLPFVIKPIERLIELIGYKLLKRNNFENTISMLDNYGNDAIAEVTINKLPRQLEGKSLFESKIRDLYKINVLMIKRKNKIIQITKDTMVQNGDILVVFGRKQSIKDLFAKQISHISEYLEKALITRENTLDIIDNYGNDAMVEIHLNVIPKFMKHQTLFETKIKEQYQINILVIRRADRPIPVTKDTVLEKYDSLVVFGPYNNIKEVFIENKKDEEI